VLLLPGTAEGLVIWEFTIKSNILEGAVDANEVVMVMLLRK